VENGDCAAKAAKAGLDLTLSLAWTFLLDGPHATASNLSS
jgi:hypothetical protein